MLNELDKRIHELTRTMHELRAEFRKMRDEANRLEVAYCCAFDNADDIVEQWLAVRARADELAKQCKALHTQLSALRDERDEQLLNPHIMAFARINT